jgi:hypothetical protein
MSNPVCKTLNDLSGIKGYNNVSLYIEKNGTPMMMADHKPLNVWFDCKPGSGNDGNPMCTQFLNDSGNVTFMPSANAVKNGVVFTARNIGGVINLGCSE